MLLTVRGEGSKKINLLTAVEGGRGGRLESKNIKILLLTVEREGVLNRTTNLLTVVDRREGG